MTFTLTLLLNTFSYIFIGLAIGFVIRYLNKSVDKEVLIAENEKTKLVLAKFYQIVGVGGILFWSAIGVLCLNIFTEDEMDIEIMLLCLIGVFEILGIVCLLYYRNHWVEFDDKVITVSDWLGKQKSIELSSITHISFEPRSGYLMIQGKEGMLKISQHIMGLRTFVTQIEQKTKWTAKEIRFTL